MKYMQIHVRLSERNSLLQEMYLDCINNFLTIDSYAEYYCIPLSAAHSVIEAGRLCHEAQVQFNKDLNTTDKE